MVHIETVCNEIISKGINESIKITPLKLQKLVYFIYGYGLAYKNKKLFSASFYAWKYGPVSEEIYHEFKSFYDNDITKYAQDAKGISYLLNKDSYENKDLIECINIVWEKYKKYTGSQLVKLTHKHGTAWQRTNSNQIIDEKLIVEDIKRKLY